MLIGQDQLPGSMLTMVDSTLKLLLLAMMPIGILILLAILHFQIALYKPQHLVMLLWLTIWQVRLLLVT